MRRREHGPVWLFWAVLTLLPISAGCIETLASAVVDDVTDPGGKLEVQIGDGAPGDLPALASGNPMAITGQSASLVVAMTCATDADGLNAATVLAKAGSQISLVIVPQNGNQLQVHIGGQSCVADTGTIHLSSGTDGALSGSFDATGKIAGTDTPVAMHGTLTSIPQAK